MSSKRFKGDEEVNVYHCILKAPDRTPGNREFAFGEAEKCKMAQLVQELGQTITPLSIVDKIHSQASEELLAKLAQLCGHF